MANFLFEVFKYFCPTDNKTHRTQVGWWATRLVKVWRLHEGIKKKTTFNLFCSIIICDSWHISACDDCNFKSEAKNLRSAARSFAPPGLFLKHKLATSGYLSSRDRGAWRSWAGRSLTRYSGASSGLWWRRNCEGEHVRYQRRNDGLFVQSTFHPLPLFFFWQSQSIANVFWSSLLPPSVLKPMNDNLLKWAC